MTRPAALLFDLDGTLYVHGVPVPGAAGVLTSLRRAGVPFRFVTNTTSRPRAALVALLGGCGIEAREPEIFTPITAAVALVRREGRSRVAPFLPEASLVDLAGLELAGGVCGSPSGGTRPEVVLVGDLGERWTYTLLQEAFEYLLDGALLVALSRDRYFKRGDRLALDAGPFVAALEYAASRAALVAGKPSPEFFGAAVASLGLGEGVRDVVMVGDDLWSDIRGAQQAGYQGWLVRTGKYRESALRESGVTPDRVLESVVDVAAELGLPASG